VTKLGNILTFWECLSQNVYNFLASSYKLVYILVTKGQNVHKCGHSTCSL